MSESKRVATDHTPERESATRAREEVANAQLGALASVFAHEVKNPLAGIRGALDVIGDRMSPGAAEQEILDTIVRRIGELNDVIDGILHYARPPSPRFELVSVFASLQRARELVAAVPSLSEVPIAIEGEDVELEADPKLLEILFANLFLNGAQACCVEGGEILVQSSRLDEGVRVVVRDTGPGIPEEARERVLEPFFTTRARGAGLGLCTAQRAARCHGGTLSIDNHPEGGARIEVTLPGSSARSPNG
jgi:signal transduction histidine kinase